MGVIIINVSLSTNIHIMTFLLFKPEFLLSMPGGSEWILILLVVLLFFGGKKIPDLMRGIGRGVREFNDAKENVKNEIDAGMREKDKTPTPEPREAVKGTELPK
jgi:sec-independent protein translocase protein TatA